MYTGIPGPNPGCILFSTPHNYLQLHTYLRFDIPPWAGRRLDAPSYGEPKRQILPKTFSQEVFKSLHLVREQR